MVELHLTENGSLLPCPPQLIVETFITKEEEFFMEIAIEKTEEFQREMGQAMFQGNVMDSDGIEELQEELAEVSRKRAAWNVSQISSSRQPSPMKKTQHRRGREWEHSQ